MYNDDVIPDITYDYDDRGYSELDLIQYASEEVILSHLINLDYDKVTGGVIGRVSIDGKHDVTIAMTDAAAAALLFKITGEEWVL